MKKERESNIDLLPLAHSLTGDWATTQACAAIGNCFEGQCLSNQAIPVKALLMILMAAD